MEHTVDESNAEVKDAAPSNQLIPDRPKSSRISGLDGLRGLAVLLVFLGHTEIGVPGRIGPFGVDIFFFLSGYLITTLLQSEFDKVGAISLKDFYKRRILRIVPPMLITICIVSVISRLLGKDSPTMGTFLIQAVSLTNYFLIYFHYNHGIPYMESMWSLSVEEHFYLIYPFLFALLYRRSEPKRLAILLCTVAAMVTLGRCWQMWQLRPYWHDTLANPTIYQSLELATHTRIDAIIYGCLFSLLANPVRGSALARRINHWPWVVLGLVLVLVGMSTRYIEDSIGYTIFGMAFVPLFTATILQSQSGFLRLFESRAMRYMGAISYTFYLIHLFVLKSLSPLIHSHLLSAAVSFAISFAFSSLMLLAVERPLARMRRRIAHA